MDFRIKQRGFFNKCQDYFTSYLKDATSTQSDEESSSSSDEDNDPGSGTVMAPSFRVSGPYKKVSTKDTRLEQG